ncbi:hypothetical protein VPH35_059829 [Triticum aestivum]|uniref:Uncharacterized protein n=1 Tax=Aegilops tauschii subsp. strangulata TaxID=200361 RepID=A0A453EXT4_AEGTS
MIVFASFQASLRPAPCLLAVKLTAVVASIQNYIHMITEEAHMAFYHLQICRRHLSLRSMVTLNCLSHYSVRVFLLMMMMPFKPCYFVMLLMSVLSGLCPRCNLLSWYWNSSIALVKLTDSKVLSGLYT